MVSRNQGNHNQRPPETPFKPTHVHWSGGGGGAMVIAETETLITVRCSDGSVYTGSKSDWRKIDDGE